jgi:uncharacterized protein YlxP (DUF503 family)
VYAALVRVELHLPLARSLKDKRAVLNRIKDRALATHAAVAETEHHDLWQRATLGMAVVAGSADRLQSGLDALRRIVDGQHDAVVVDWQVTHHE